MADTSADRIAVSRTDGMTPPAAAAFMAAYRSVQRAQRARRSLDDLWQGALLSPATTPAFIAGLVEGLCAARVVRMSASRRRAVLAAAVRRQRGPWTTARVLRIYAAEGLSVTAAAARADLTAHATAGLLIRHRDRGITYYYAPKDTA